MLFLFMAAALAAPLDYNSLAARLQNNGEWKKSHLLLEAAEQRRGALKRSFLPTVVARAGREQFTLGPGPRRTQSYATLEANINVYNGGRDSLSDDVRVSASQQKGAEGEGLRRSVLTRTRELWNAWQHHQAAVDAIKTSLAENERHWKEAKKRVRAGLATEADTLDFEQFGLELKQSLAREEEEVHDHGRLLQAVLQLPEPPALPTASTHEHADELLDTPFDPSAHPAARAQNAEALGLKAQAAKAERWWRPRVDVYGAVTRYSDRQQFFEHERDREDIAVGAMLSVPLFDGGEARRESRSWALAQAAEEAHAAQTQQELRASHEKALVHVRLTHDLLHQAQESLRLAERYMQVTLAEYQRGVKLSPDVREANARVNQAQLNLAQTRWDHETARVHLMELLGQ